MSSIAVARPHSQAFSTTRLNLGTWVLPAFTAAVAGLLSLRPALDPDFGWHLRVGQMILKTHQVNHLDAFSYTMSGKPWADFEWLWETSLAALQAATGSIGPILATGCVTAATTLLVYAYLRLRSVGPLFASLGAMAAVVNLMAYADVRPGMMGPLFCALFITIIEQARRTGNGRWLLALLPAQLLWANLHGSYIQAILLCACYALGTIWEDRRWQAGLRWVGLAAALLVVSLINPMGVGLLRFTLGASHMTWNHDHNGEWLAPNFHLAAFWPLLATILVTVALATLWRPRRVSKPAALLLLLGTLAVLQSNQFLPFYAVAAAPVLAQLLQGIIQRPIKLSLRAAHAVGFAGALAYLAFGAFRGLQPAAYEAALAKSYPVQAVAYIHDHNLSGPMFNEFDWGSYLMSALPRLPVFVDGRTEMYGDDFLQRYVDVTNGHTDPQPYLDGYGVNLVLVRSDAPLASVLSRNPMWHEQFHDHVASIFVRGGSSSS
jgi:hypothetical protein